MSAADKDGRILQALGDRLVCLGMSMNESVIKQTAKFDAIVRNATKPTEPEEHRAEVERLTKSVGAFSAARDAAKKGWQETKDQVARVEALATAFEDAARTFDDGEPNSAAWCRHAATSIRAALAEPERDEESGR